MRILNSAVDLVFGKRLPEVGTVVDLPAGVVLREGSLVPRIGGILGGMSGPAAAVTLRRTIIICPGVRLTAPLLRHELVHVRQWSDDWLFPLKYIAECLRHGYHDNAYECEAREAEASADRLPPTESAPWPTDPS